MKTSIEEVITIIRREFGLKEGVKFNLTGSRCNPYHFAGSDLIDNDGSMRSLLTLLAYGDIEVIPEPLLTDDERDFLKLYISLIKEGVSTIEKKEMPNGIYIKLWHDGYLTAMTPLLKDSFEGLEDGKEYPLEELGL